MPPAPIALFVFKRPDETLKTLEHLARNRGIEQSELIIYCDAPRNPGEALAVQRTREIVRSRNWCPRMRIIERDSNWGLANSIIAGVTELVASHGRVIVLEDDLLLATGTLAYMNEALDRYYGCEQVMQISGHTFSAPNLGEPGGSFFVPLTTSWGWATWSRAWSKFDANASGSEELQSNSELRHRFDMDGGFPYTELLQQQQTGKVDSWAIYWRWTMFRNNGLTLYPTRTLIKNIGFGASSTHTPVADEWLLSRDWQSEQEISSFPPDIRVDEARWREIKRFFRKSNYPSFPARIVRKVRRIMRSRKPFSY